MRLSKWLVVLILVMVAQASSAAVHRKVWLENSGDDYIDLCVRVWGDSAPEKPDSMVVLVREPAPYYFVNDVYGWGFADGFAGARTVAADSVGISMRYAFGYYHTMDLPVKVKMRYNTGAYAVVTATDDIVVTDPIPAFAAIDTASFLVTIRAVQKTVSVFFIGETDVASRLKLNITRVAATGVKSGAWTGKQTLIPPDTAHDVAFLTTLAVLGDSLIFDFYPEQGVGTLYNPPIARLYWPKLTPQTLAPTVSSSSFTTVCTSSARISYTFSTNYSCVTTLEWKLSTDSWPGTPVNTNYNGNWGSGARTHENFRIAGSSTCAAVSGNVYNFRVKFTYQDLSQSADINLPDVTWP